MDNETTATASTNEKVLIINNIPELPEDVLAALIGEAAYVGHGLEANPAKVNYGGMVFDVIAVLGADIEVRLGSYRTEACADRHGKEFCARVLSACGNAGITVDSDAIGWELEKRRLYKGTKGSATAKAAKATKKPKKAAKQPEPATEPTVVATNPASVTDSDPVAIEAALNEIVAMNAGAGEYLAGEALPSEESNASTQEQVDPEPNSAQ